MQVSANVAAKNAAQATSSSTGSPRVKSNGSNDSEPMSFAEFEQRLDKPSEPKEEVTERDEVSAELSQDQSQEVSAEAQALQDKTPQSLAMSLAQQNALAALPKGSSTENPIAGLDEKQQAQLLAQLSTQASEQLSGQVSEQLSAQLSNPLVGQQIGQSKGQDAAQQMNQLLAQLTGQQAQTDPANAELLEQMQHLLKQQKANTGDALPLAKDMAIPFDGSLMDKLAATTLSGPAMNMHSNLSSQINSNMSLSSSSAAAATTQQLHAGVDITEPEWGRDLVEQLRSRLQLSKTDQIQHAHVRLDPPELGRLEVNLRLEGDKVSVHFTAAHPQLREALAANADRLRFDFDGSQMQLADVSVSSGLHQQSHQQSGAEGESDIMANQVVMQAEDTSSATLSGLDGRYEAMV